MPLGVGIAIIVLQDVATKVGTDARMFTFDDVHGVGASSEEVVYDQIADILAGEGLNIPDTRTRIADAYGELDQSTAKKNLREL